ncbi:alpha/beta hydrolase family protein [Pseudopedobacter beijingensis]|uniref:Alpha/beta hydrolase family protein n=1 Tax=Pseudopedobacter beijingensis TaxID=1207056 RepID=A0ABW4IC14_9SPHI
MFIKSLKTNETYALTTFEGKSIRDYCWVGDHYLVMIAEDIACKEFGLYTSTVNGSRQEEIVLSNTISKLDFIQNNNKSGDKEILFCMNERTPDNTDVYRLNVETSVKQMIIENPGNVIEWYADENNNIRLARGSKGTNEVWYYRSANANAVFKQMMSNYFTTSIQPIMFIRNKEHRLYALSNIGRDKYALVEFNCDEGKEEKLIFECKKADLIKAAFSKKLNTITYVSTNLDKRKTFFLQDTTEMHYKNIRKALKSEIIEVKDHDEDENNYILFGYTDKTPGAYYLYNLEKKSLLKIGEVNSDIISSDMADMQPVSYKSRDGQQIHGYLTISKANVHRKPPLVVLVHDGPYCRDVWGYNAEVQFLANRGFAVFQMNFRGSTGYGKQFYEAGFGQWDKAIQNDIEDGVKWLMSQSLVDPDRIAVYGKGFGGFSAFNQSIQLPGFYKCAVSYSGFLNLFTYMKGIPAYYNPHHQIIEKVIGSPIKNVEQIKAASPIFQSDKIGIPIMIFQGGKDSKANANETSQFVKELKKQQKQVTYILKEEEGHQISNLNNKVYFYKHLESFLEKNMSQKIQ